MKIYDKLRNSKVAKDSFGYTLLNFAEKALPFLILPIITRKLTVEDVGFYMLYQSLIEILLPLLTLNIDQSILLNFYKLENEKFKIYLSNGLILFLPIFLIFVVVVLLSSDLVMDYLGFPLLWLNVIVLIAFFRFIAQIRLNIWRVKYKIKIYGVSICALSIVNNGVGLLLVFYTKLGWGGLLAGQMIGYFFFSILSVISFYKEKLFDFTYNKEYILDAIKIGVPMTLHRIGIWFGTTVNRIIIATLLGAAATGSYGVAATFATIITILEDAFSKAVTPHMFEKLKTDNIKIKIDIVKMSYSIYAFLIVVSFVTYIVGYFGASFIFGDKFEPTKHFLLPLILAAMFKGFYKLHVNYIFFSKRTIEITKITLSTGLLNLFLAYSLIERFGLLGAAYSVLVINLLQYITSFYIGNKLLPMPWQHGFFASLKFIYTK